jgi:predicted transcriptional regulator
MRTTLTIDDRIARALKALAPGIDLTNALRLADALEDDEVARKLELPK